MKTRGAVMEASNIAAIVKARHHARVLCSPGGNPLGTTQNQLISTGIYESSETSCNINNFYSVSATSGQTLCDDVKASVEDKAHKSRSENAPRLLRGTWSPDDRRLFFQAVRLYGRNFNEITRFIRSRGHRTSIDQQTGSSSSNIDLTLNNVHSANNSVSSNALSSALIPSNVSAPCPSNISQPNVGVNTPCTTSNSDLNTPCGGRTREQVRFFYQQTWHKVRRYTKFPEEVPQHVREVYAIVNYSVLRTRIKKPLDHRLGEKLNELVHCGTTVIKHNGRRFLLRTPVCPALKQLNNISAPTHEFLLPEDVWIELVPRTQTDAWRVVEAEQNPRLRLRVDINRQLSDVIFLVENKWRLAAERMRTLLGLPVVNESHVPSVMLNLCSDQAVDGAIRIQEVARIRSGDIGLRAYLDRMNTKPPKSQIQSNVCATDKQTGVQNDPTESPNLVNSNLLTNLASSLYTSESEFTSGLPITTSTSTAELDLRDLGKQLSVGITHEMAREIKVVTIYLALGCPERIRFEYQFYCTKDKGTQKLSSSSYSDLLICPPLDPDGDGISNGLRRLLHLNASDYLLHRDWVSRHSIRSDTSLPISCHSSQVTPNVNNPVGVTITTIQSSSNTSTLLSKSSTGSHLSQITSESPIMVTAQQPLVVTTTTISSRQPTIMMYSQPNTIQVLINGQPSFFQLNSSTLSASNPIISSLLTTNSLIRPTTVATVQSPKLVVLQQPVRQKIQLPIVERQLDHVRQVTSAVAMSQGSYIPLLPKQSTVPIQTSVKTSTPLISNFVLSNSISSTSTNTIESENNPPVTSSLKSLKAFNARRRTSIVSQVNKRLTENSILAKELQSKPSICTSLSSNAPPSYNNTSTNSSNSTTVQLLQSIDHQTLPTIKGDEASANNNPSKSITLSTPSNSNHNLWSSSIKVLNDEQPVVTTSTSIVFNDQQLPQGHSISSSSLLSPSPNVSSLQSDNVMSFITLSKNPSNTDDLLLVSTETNQSSMSSSYSNDTLASLLNTICPRYPLSSTSLDNQIIESSHHQPIDNTLSPLVVESSTPDVHKTFSSSTTIHDKPVSLKIEETGEKSYDFRTIDSVCSSSSYPPGSPPIGDISFTDSMAAAVMDVHHMELDHSDGERSTDVQYDSSNLLASNLVIQPDMYSLGPSYEESLVEHEDIKTSTDISTSEYNCITNVEVFLRMNTPQFDRSSISLNSTLQTSTTSSE